MSKNKNNQYFFLLFHYSSPNSRAVMKSEKSDSKNVIKMIEMLHDKIMEIMESINKTDEISISYKSKDLNNDCNQMKYGTVGNKLLYLEKCKELAEELTRMIDISRKFQKSKI